MVRNQEGESRHALARAVFLHQLGELRSRIAETMAYRASSDFDSMIRNRVYHQHLTARRKLVGTTNVPLRWFLLTMD
jgi:hypothetical protein